MNGRLSLTKKLTIHKLIASMIVRSVRVTISSYSIYHHAYYNKSVLNRFVVTSHLANRFRNHGDAYFEFITTPGIDPTNNLAEQAIRFIVIDRYITQNPRNERGRIACERIWGVIATCAMQDDPLLLLYAIHCGLSHDKVTHGALQSL